jgi:hypothetical protein
MEPQNFTLKNEFNATNPDESLQLSENSKFSKASRKLKMNSVEEDFNFGILDNFGQDQFNYNRMDYIDLNEMTHPENKIEGKDHISQIGQQT